MWTDPDLSALFFYFYQTNIFFLCTTLDMTLEYLTGHEGKWAIPSLIKREHWPFLDYFATQPRIFSTFAKLAFHNFTSFFKCFVKLWYIIFSNFFPSNLNLQLKKFHEFYCLLFLLEKSWNCDLTNIFCLLILVPMHFLTHLRPIFFIWKMHPCWMFLFFSVLMYSHTFCISCFRWMFLTFYSKARPATPYFDCTA